eukprot:CAMPEP_0170521898 /NCGR_PEP_ID=MMETSP0209-20121228/7307_1 /TAXON_ID=665100 ORGANISM="Litonotus pictus, Strain P1" /NCGR_SAMPLE_ID=MMETSP0209 /ASSEMBLY_ACC=CAM_ASM_000301 /LENGTH=600 /DNA_ID=CAMNT_0010809069 /DNA_START=867 /DNA_END=2666 /DNA_ORIENTATION=+
MIITNIGYISDEEKHRYTGAIQPLGDIPEGFCLQVNTKEPPVGNSNSKSFSPLNYGWVICTDKASQRDRLIELLIDLKLNQQKEEVSSKLSEASRSLLKKQALSEMSSSFGTESSESISRGKTTSPNDGRWILLQDWSQCSKKCGGGTQFQQWMCVPPKPNGNPCEGSPVVTKECNTKPCPSFGIADHNEFVKNINLKPVIKSLPFSQRPQQRIFCKIREGDVLFDAMEVINSKEVFKRVPARLVLNNRTISLFQDDNYIKSSFNFPLDKTIVSPSAGNHCCLLIKSQNKAFNVCGGFGSECGSKQKPVFANDWLEDFNLFKTKCQTPVKEESMRKEQDQAFLNEQMNQVKLDMVNQTESMLKERLAKQKEAAAMANIKKTQETAVKVLKKEFNLEEMLAKEEQQRALNETKELLLLKKTEEKKRECLEQALKVKEDEQKKKRENKQMLNNIDKVKEETLKEVEEQRELLKKRIAAIRTKTQKRNRQIKREINIIRSKMAQGLMEADRLGNKDICINSMTHKEEMNEYCNDNKNTTLEENEDCKDIDRFCYVCCDTEIGSIHLKEREACYGKCGDILRVKNAGTWVWQKGKNFGKETSDL